MKQNSFSLIISAPSGGGKTTIIRRILKENPLLEFSVSTTTRKLREGEVEGKSYYSVSRDDFMKAVSADEFIEFAEVHGSLYGTSKKEIDRIRSAEKIPVFDVDVQGAESLRKSLPGAVFVFIVPPSMDVLEERLRSRKTETDDQIQLRLNNAMQEIKSYRFFDYIVVNDCVEEAVARLQAIIVSELCRTERNFKIIKMLEDWNDNSNG